jgi:excisionase family DNA binding protein
MRHGGTAVAEAPDDTLAEKLVGDGMLDVPAACAFTGLGRTFLYGMMDRGELRYAKIGKRRLIPKAELIRLLAGGLVSAAS